METLRIVMTSTFYPPYHIGGDAVHVKLLAKELVNRGHEVHVMHSLDAFYMKGGQRVHDDQIEKEDGVFTYPLSSNLGRFAPYGTYLTGRNRQAERELERLRHEVQPDWVHHHNISLLGGELIKNESGVSIYTAHDYWLICPRSDLMYLGRSTCQQRRCNYCSLATKRPPQFWRETGFIGNLKNLDLVISPSRFMASSLNRFLGISSTVLPNFQRVPSSLPTVCSDESYFVYAGVLGKYKGIDLLLKTFERGNLRSSLRIMGRGSMESEVRQASASSRGKIAYLGFVPEIERQKQIASAVGMVAPSIWNENGPLTCIEALSMGTPLIVTRNGGLPELVEDPECGLACEATVDDLEHALLRIEGNPELQRRLSSNALLKYQKCYTPERYLNSYLTLCKKVMS